VRRRGGRRQSAAFREAAGDARRQRAAAQQALGATGLVLRQTPRAPALDYLWTSATASTSTEVAPTHVYARPASSRPADARRRPELGQRDEQRRRRPTSPSSPAELQPRPATRWCWPATAAAGNFILDYAFVDDSRGWAVGQGGTRARDDRRRRDLEPPDVGTTLDIGQAAFPSATRAGSSASSASCCAPPTAARAGGASATAATTSCLALGASDADNAWLHDRRSAPASSPATAA
jgi:hypothetical protein